MQDGKPLGSDDAGWAVEQGKGASEEGGMASVAGVTNHEVKIAREVAEAVPVAWIREGVGQ